jgi:hypothetical protein
MSTEHDTGDTIETPLARTEPARATTLTLKSFLDCVKTDVRAVARVSSEKPKTPDVL